MITLAWFFIGFLFTVAACDAEQKWNATVGENVTIPFKTAEQEKANRVTVIFLKEETVIAQYCCCAHCEDCDVVKKPGVLLQVVEGTVWLTLQDVSIRNSGTYKARIFIGNKVFKETGSLLVNVAVCDIELKLEAPDGKDFNIPLETELERANRVRITFKRDNEETVHLIAQSCALNESCSFVETPGILLNIERRILILQNVSSNNSGLYEAQVFFGNNVFKITATLVNNHVCCRSDFCITKNVIQQLLLKKPEKPLLSPVAVCAPELKLEATVGEDVTISFKTSELERATRVRITFKGEHEEKARLIVQFCAYGEQCDVVETPGVLLRVKQGTLILQRVSFNNSGLYEAMIITGKEVSEKNATLVVKKPAFSSTKTPLHTSIKNPPNSSEHQWLYALLILPVIALGVVVFLFWRKKCKRVIQQLMMKKYGSSRLTAEHFMFSVDQVVVNSHITIFSDALKLMFASYYCFNISYQGDQGATLEFVQSDEGTPDEIKFCLYEHYGDCNPKSNPGVLLKTEERILILQNVSSNNSGRYKIRVIGEKVHDIKATLVVKKPALSLTEVPRHSTPKPRNSSEQHRLYTLLIFPVILVVYLF
ncbi:hypothetical protein ROHU_014999 [Labeo rohita]|uniref:Immunoglobulin domain-containing protein n=1 Tax=Labeo rohita TaxID=84645 RepID=A0A498NR71_LABRO|nr:hypothetical protein ROHU_014999 [Labeo rohita]